MPSTLSSEQSKASHPLPRAAGPDLKRFSRRAGDEPITGYRLMEPLGVGGFGEVWKCEAPGGLHKALKIVTMPTQQDGADQGTPAQHEQTAIERIKSIRHPYLISIDRVDQAAGELFIVMELAEHSAWDEFEQNRKAGRFGVPEFQLLHYLLEAAEILDVLRFQHGLQHLDVKPGNLLISGGHVKLTDFGLVSPIAADPDANRELTGCFTPRYASPELLQGNISAACDQYSLAIVYQELLTGELAYPGNGLLKRLLKAPDVKALPESDRPAVTRALANNPLERFSSCREFVHALLAARLHLPRERYSLIMNFNRLSPGEALACPSAPATNPLANSGIESAETPTAYRGTVAVARESDDTPSARPPQSPPVDRTNTPSEDAGASDIVYPPTIHISDLRWKPDPSGEIAPALDDFVARLVESATGKPYQTDPDRSRGHRELPGEVLEDSFIMPAVSSTALRQQFERIVRDCHGEVLVPSERFIVFAVEVAVPFWKMIRSRQHVLKITIRVDPLGREQADLCKAIVRVEPFDPEGPPVDPNVLGVRPVLLRNARTVLQATPERRRNERWPCSVGATLFPVMGEWQFGQAIDAKVIDICADGVGLLAPEDPSVKQFYLRPSSPNSLRDFAVLLRVVRHRTLPNGTFAWGGVLGRV